MDQHEKTIIRSCFFPSSTSQISPAHPRQRSYTRPGVSFRDNQAWLNCNSVLAGLPQATINLLQRVQNAAARLVAGIGTWDHITPVLRSLHWLPIKLRIQYKLCAYAPGVHRSQSCLPGWHDDSHRQSIIYPVVKDFVPPAVFDTKPHNWNSSLVSEVSCMPDQRLGTLFPSISRNSRTLILLKNNWKLTYLSSPMNDEYWLCWCTTGHFRCKRRCEIM